MRPRHRARRGVHMGSEMVARVAIGARVPRIPGGGARRRARGGVDRRGRRGPFFQSTSRDRRAPRSERDARGGVERVFPRGTSKGIRSRVGRRLVTRR